MEEIRIGVTGYTDPRFDITEAQRIIKETYDRINSQYPDRQKAVVSGLTDLGIPALAYREAVNRGWKTMGIACAKAFKSPCFPVDETIIVGNEWGEESSTFLDNLEILVRIGGGAQAKKETAEAKARGKQVMEYDLPSIT